jgi:hypothetical protein
MRRLNIERTEGVRMYQEKNQERVASQSLVYLMKVLERAWRMYGKK